MVPKQAALRAGPAVPAGLLTARSAARWKDYAQPYYEHKVKYCTVFQQSAGMLPAQLRCTVLPILGFILEGNVLGALTRPLNASHVL